MRARRSRCISLKVSRKICRHFPTPARVHKKMRSGNDATSRRRHRLDAAKQERCSAKAKTQKAPQTTVDRGLRLVSVRTEEEAGCCRLCRSCGMREACMRPKEMLDSGHGSKACRLTRCERTNRSRDHDEESVRGLCTQETQDCPAAGLQDLASTDTHAPSNATRRRCRL